MQITKQDILALIGTVKVHYSFTYKDFTSGDFKILCNSWFEDLKDYPKELVFIAFGNAKKVNKISITTADIIEQINKMQSATQDTDNALWLQLDSVLYKVSDLAYAYRYSTYIYDNSISQSAEAYEKIKKIFNELDPLIQAYCVNERGLIHITEIEPEQLEFEKGRFLKAIPNLKERAKIQEQYPALEMAKNIGLIKEKNIGMLEEKL